MIEALVLRCAVRWERLVESDILASINRDSSGYSKKLGLSLRKHLTRDECEAIIIGHRYLDFKSVNDVKNFANKFLVKKYNPFVAITKDIEDKIDEFMLMRNLLTHYSSYTWRSYKQMMTKKYFYKKIPEPGAFLIKINRKNKNVYRWGEHIINFIDCSERMRKGVRS